MALAEVQRKKNYFENPENSLLNKSSSLAAALDAVEFLTLIALILVTICCVA